MREILFRGVGKNTGRWEFGNLVRFTNGDCAIINGSGSDSYLLLHVRPETVGQYTGLDDKNGVKIFEGDILRGSMVNLIVAYEGAGFIAYWMDHDYGYGTEKMWCNLVEGGEVIGNIHDNPEVQND